MTVHINYKQIHTEDSHPTQIFETVGSTRLFSWLVVESGVETWEYTYNCDKLVRNKGKTWTKAAEIELIWAWGSIAS